MSIDSAGNPLLHRWGVVIALLAVFSALVFNGVQTRIGTDAVRLQTAALEAQAKSLDAQSKAFEAQVWQMMTQQQLEISKILIENPELLPYFRNNKRINSSHKYFDRVMEVADLYLDFFDGFDDDYVRSLPKMGTNGENWIRWEKYFRDTFALSPALCSRFSEVKDWYTESVGQYAEKGCSINASNRTYLDSSRHARKAP